MQRNIPENRYTFDLYQKDVGQFAIYPDANTGSNTELSYLALGLGGESGEVLEKVKKLIRDGVFEPEEVVKELGDVLWYISRLCNAMGYEMGDVANRNYNKLRDRQQRNVIQGSGDNR